MTASKEDLNKDLEILIFCLTRSYENISIRYTSTHSHDIYYVANPKLFLRYISELLRRHAATSHITVVIINIDLTVTLEMLDFVSAMLKERREFSEAGEIASTPLANYQEPRDSPRLGDNSSSKYEFRLHIVNDCSFESKKSIFSAKQVALQQLLRFLSIRHEATFVASSKLKYIIKDSSATLKFLALLKDETAQPVFDFFRDESDSVSIHQKIPLGWDTIHKILLVAKSAPHLSAESCFQEEKDLESLETALLGSSCEPSESGLTAKLASYNLVELEPKKLINERPPTSTTYRDVLQQLKNSI